MLDFNFEFRRGVLFIRLVGELTSRTVKVLDQNVTYFIKDNGIRNVVFNVSLLNKIDLKGISRLFYNYELCRKNRGVSLLCCSNNDIIASVIDDSNMISVNSELAAFNFIN